MHPKAVPTMTSSVAISLGVRTTAPNRYRANGSAKSSLNEGFVWTMTNERGGVFLCAPTQAGLHTREFCANAHHLIARTEGCGLLTKESPSGRLNKVKVMAAKLTKLLVLGFSWIDYDSTRQWPSNFYFDAAQIK